MPTIMSTSPGIHEITELSGKHKSESKIIRDTKNQHSGKTLKNNSIEDDINKLFEAIDIGSPRLPDRHFRDKSAMKRPMRISPSQVSDIGISESVSLKQALRGLCISQASEMAAVRKRMSGSSALPGISETGAIKKLYRSVVIEENEDGKSNDKGRGNLVEISLVPEINSSKFSDKAPESGHGCQLAKADKEISNLIKSPNRRLGLTGRGLITQDFVKNVPKRTFVSKSVGQRNVGAKNDRDCHKGKMVHPTPDSVSDEKSRSKEKGEFSQSSKSSSIGEYSSTTSYYSEESYLSAGSSRSGYRPHMSKDLRWEAISCVQKQNGGLSLRNFKMLRKIGGGDIGTVYRSELIGTSCHFAVKIVDNDLLVSRKKMMRAQTEREIMEILDHPFLPTLYAHFGTDKFSCLVMEYCPGGDLHVLRQKQLTRSFPEKAARFYAAEVLLALEYLHMLGVVYRDLKPENILVREDGHIMLSDFDLSLRCTVNPMLLNPTSPTLLEQPKKTSSSPCSNSSCIDPFCLQPSWQLSCFTPRFLSTHKLKSELASQVIPLPQLVVEPTNARSNSFVGTHEYLAPEIVKGEGHGSPVDWWTFGILLYELLYGGTPFKGPSNEETVSNVVSRCLKFPHCPMVSCHARDLIRRLLRKEPENRLGWEKGAAEIKGHPFFDGLNWALVRCERPPEMPKVFELGSVVTDSVCESKNEIEFEMF